MSPRAAYHYVPHTIRHDPEGGVSYEIRCDAPDCAAESGPQQVQEAAQDWTLRHAGRTGHAFFRRVVTDHARVTREE
ncbi:hypothetical protein K4749_30955 [Streptomyces sp. TRM72054]|uniref:DUF7848 domain-containing protein n=1 Tax=Streptomyces sp. TRM72054 TaxID=2870562 RepID=UPI001C8C475E|nr:hypothetical protein [Streptomyces sp. TRM72054]MBX9397890.1 hypothetical protein [Streptomyces sp. TRM72054]